jgi:thioredoxin-related protein
MAGALEPIKEIHAIRLKIQDETNSMTFEKRREYYKQSTEDLFSSMGLPSPHYVSFPGQGKLQPKVVVGK